MASHPPRPPDEEFYEPKERTKLFSIGDIFRDVPLAYPLPASEIVIDEDSRDAGRRFLSGPIEFGPAMLTTPSCSLGSPDGTRYVHPVRTLVPLLPLSQLVKEGFVKEGAVPQIRKYDQLINYMYLPPLEVAEHDFAMEESLALLYMPVTLHHDIVSDGRVSQLAYKGAQQLQRKLVWFVSGWLEENLDVFNPPMD